MYLILYSRPLGSPFVIVVSVTADTIVFTTNLFDYQKIPFTKIVKKPLESCETIYIYQKKKKQQLMFFSSSSHNHVILVYKVIISKYKTILFLS